MGSVPGASAWHPAPTLLGEAPHQQAELPSHHRLLAPHQPGEAALQGGTHHSGALAQALPQLGGRIVSDQEEELGHL